MIPESLPSLWRQLNGPQASSLMEAILCFYEEKFDGYLEYLYNLSLDTASNNNLTELGVLLNIIRPNLTTEIYSHFWFVLDWSSSSHDELHGFSDTFGIRESTDDTSVLGGVFTELDESATTTNPLTPVSDIVYKQLLNANIGVYPGSVIYLDNLIVTLYNSVSIPPSDSDCGFIWIEEDDEITNAVSGDLVVYTGALDSNLQEAIAISSYEVQELIINICKQSYQPAPIGHAWVGGYYYSTAYD